MYSEHSAAIAAPPHRRRRPALACAQCRRRKIKCDQNKPCNQCQRSKNTICTYNSSRHDNEQLAGSRHSLESIFQPHARESSIVHNPPSTTTPRFTESDLIDAHAIISKYPAIETLVIDDLHKQRRSTSGLTPDIETHAAGLEGIPSLSPRQCPSKTSSKTSLFGENHWMSHFAQFERIFTYLYDNERTGASDHPSELCLLFQQCKALARTIKSQRPRNTLAVPDYKSTIPAKEVCDELVANYFRNFESVYRIIHIPSFYASYADYWGKPDDNNFWPMLILVLAIGTVFLPDSVKAASLRFTARQWVYAAQQWLSAPLEKSRMNIRGVQIQCLLILARETIGIGTDLIWTSVGTLMRSAMQLGYHRDPQIFQGMSPLHAEMRRRLWSTIMEMSVQAAFQSAMVPLISLDDFDTEPPLNINDDEIDRSTETPPVPHPPSVYTQTTLQLHLHRSFHARLEAVRLTSTFRNDPPYEHVLKLSEEITSSCLFPSFTPQPPPFHLNHLDLLLRRPLFALHRHWVIKAKTDPQYYFSRKVMIENSLAHTSYLPDDDWQHLLIDTPDQGRTWLPILYITLELTWQLEQESPGGRSSTQAKLLRAPLIASLRRSVEFQRLRFQGDEMSARGPFFIAAVLAQIEAMERGESEEGVQRAIAEAAVGSVRECFEILKGKAEAAASNEERGNGEDNGLVAAGGEYDFLQDTWDTDDMGMGMDFEMNDMEEFGKWNEGSYF